MEAVRDPALRIFDVLDACWLDQDERAALFAAVENPCRETWEEALGIVFLPAGATATVWKAVLAYTDCEVLGVPTGEEVLVALERAVADHG